MQFLVGTVVLAGTLCVVDLVLTFAVLRRLREHTERLSQLSAAGNSSPGIDRDALLGRALPEFSAKTVNGTVVSRESVTGSVELIGMFLPGCSPCRTQAPRFVDAARKLGSGRALAVIAGSGPDADHLIETFKDVTEVVIDPASGELITGLRLSAFPAFLRLNSVGAIVDAAVSVEALADVGSADHASAV
jgi:hypothetical protein